MNHATDVQAGWFRTSQISKPILRAKESGLPLCGEEGGTEVDVVKHIHFNVGHQGSLPMTGQQLMFAFFF